MPCLSGGPGPGFNGAACHIRSTVKALAAALASCSLRETHVQRPVRKDRRMRLLSGSSLTRTMGWPLALGLASALLACAAPELTQEELQRPADQTVAPLVSRAERSREAGDFDTAIPAYAEAFERTPWNTKIKRALAVTHTERAANQRSNGSLAGAEKDLRAALELYPDDPEFRRSLAVVLLERSSYEADPAKAESLRNEARSFSPDLAIPEQRVDATLERRMDLAYEL